MNIWYNNGRRWYRWGINIKEIQIQWIKVRGFIKPFYFLKRRKYDY